MVYDGCARHYNDEIVKISVELKVILFLFPDNTTHLIHPLDIAVLKPFKLVLRKCVSDLMLENAITTISKKDAMNIGSKSWREVIESKTTNIASGFRSEGMQPLSFTAIQRQLKLFKEGGISNSEENPTWMRSWDTFRTEVLSLPPEIDRLPQRRRSEQSVVFERKIELDRPMITLFVGVKGLLLYSIKSVP